METASLFSGEKKIALYVIINKEKKLVPTKAPISNNDAAYRLGNG